MAYCCTMPIVLPSRLWRNLMAERCMAKYQKQGGMYRCTKGVGHPGQHQDIFGNAFPRTQREQMPEPGVEDIAIARLKGFAELDPQNISEEDLVAYLKVIVG